jgi:SAM-dependent methyltransferase
MRQNSLSKTLAVSLVALALGVNGALAQAAPAAKPFEPQVGQSGKDVIWVPTPQSLVDRMLDVAKVTKDDFVIDLGSGDGRTVITAAKRGVKALGIEYNPEMVELSKRNAEREGVADRVEFVKADLFETDFSKATVITMFLLPDINLRLRPKLLDMKPGTRIVSNTFSMGDWPPDDTVDGGEACTSYCKAYYWVIPAKVDGVWKTPQGELALEQKFQRFTGSLTADGVRTPITDGRLEGDRIAFTAGAVRFTGQVAGDAITGATAGGGRDGPWTASRRAP